MNIIRKQAGFTLIELLMSIVLISIIMVVVSRLYVQGVTSMLTSQNVTDATSQGRLAIERMVREIRGTRSAADISVMTASEYSFTDINGNSISYSLSGSSLMRNTEILANGISSLAFGYYDKNANVSTSSSTIAYVSITINVTQANANYSLLTGVNLRDVSS